MSQHEIFIGASASRTGLSPQQKHTIAQKLLRLAIAHASKAPAASKWWLRHGDCIGGDSDIHDIAVDLHYRIAIHPPENEALRAWKQGQIYLPAQPYLVRNRIIADMSSAMIICPDTPNYKTRSGTWYTWKYALGIGRKTLLILPDGTCQTWNFSGANREKTGKVSPTNKTGDTHGKKTSPIPQVHSKAATEKRPRPDR